MYGQIEMDHTIAAVDRGQDRVKSIRRIFGRQVLKDMSMEIERTVITDGVKLIMLIGVPHVKM